MPSRRVSTKQEQEHEEGFQNPQGTTSPLSPLEPPAPPGDYPTTTQQARNNIRQFPHCVLLTRVGGFYEMYFVTTEEYGPLLGLKVAQKVSAGSVSMTGFPLLRSRSTRIPRKGGIPFNWRITRVVTPGTLIDENFMDRSESHCLLAVGPGAGVGSDRVAGLAWLDLSTGSFFTQETTVGDLRTDIARIGPKEVVLLDAGKRYFIAHHSVDMRVILGEVKSWKGTAETKISKTTTEEMKDFEVQDRNHFSIIPRRDCRGWLWESPITPTTAIERRLNPVETFKNDTYLKQHIQGLLKSTNNSQRLLQRMSLVHRGARDLAGLRRTANGRRRGPTKISKTNTRLHDEEGPLKNLRQEESEEIAAALAEADWGDHRGRLPRPCSSRCCSRQLFFYI
ncbi:hypothetical protein HOY82DRAFT_631634 [Tuber indicum]|nr:hypothetical protein HOY82DRAFT_631634 [Tuber indicum]